MARRVLRRFEAFAMHAHHDTTATYVDLFKKLEDLRREDRVITIPFRTHDTVIGFPIVSSEGSTFFIRAVEGRDAAALILNIETGRTRENLLEESEVLGEAAHLVVSPAKRRAAIEYVRGGPKASIICAAIEGLLRKHYPELSEVLLEFSPVVGGTFAKEINAFERIRAARIRVVRPNASWTEHYTELSALMEESGGDKGEIGIRATEGKSLKKASGLVKVIKDVVGDSQPYLDDAAVTGTREGETAETTIRARKHIVHTKANIDADDAGVASADDVRSKLLRFLRIL